MNGLSSRCTAGQAAEGGWAGLERHNNCVQTFKSSPTRFDLTKYFTSLNILSVLSVHGYTPQNIVSAALLLI